MMTPQGAADVVSRLGRSSAGGTEPDSELIAAALVWGLASVADSISTGLAELARVIADSGQRRDE